MDEGHFDWEKSWQALAAAGWEHEGYFEEATVADWEVDWDEGVGVLD